MFTRNRFADTGPAQSFSVRLVLLAKLLIRLLVSALGLEPRTP
ncbi:hypothetical protein GGD64_003566 [Bradyrhizobium sp. CIR3A]|nr:hypothetical protein [Bradyrhizobium sp. CIR3A]